jgi:23S rRNA (cytosine1962-C5)-methyltransferase
VSSEGASPGDLAVIYGPKRQQIGLGLYDPRSPLRVRVLHHGGATAIDDAFFAARIAAALALRAPLASGNTDGYRLVHGENDRLPGLVVDRYGHTLVVKLDSVAWVRRLAQVLAPLEAALAPRHVVLRLSRHVMEHVGDLHGLRDGMALVGEAGTTLFRENGIVFECDPVHGQKTGFFLDQRDNRARVESRSAGRMVLNAFAYTGGFSLYAARGGARAVVSLDQSAPALAACERNFAHNPALGAVHHETLCNDAFAALTELANANKRFGLVVIDPPAFAKKRDEIDRALASYARLCRLGLGVLEPGGELVMASCSSRVTRDAFRDTVLDAARRAGRPLRVMLETDHALDHPVGFVDGAYLKCLYLA